MLIGLIAVFLYDCMRVPFIITGIWGDFIPKINMWLFNTSQPNWVVGYIWRYVGDGRFMGMASIMRFQDVLEAAVGEEETVKLPPLLRIRPIWEHKTAGLSQL
jgi:hypothetical protein